MNAGFNRSFLYLIVSLSTLLFLLISTTAHAQNKLDVLTETKLRRPVHLQLGTTTVGKVMSALSAQTGVKFEAVVYLEERSVIVQMDNLPASNALQALAACHEWTWSEPERGHIVVRRPLPKVPRKLADIPLAVASCLPKDVRNYLTLELPLDPSENPASLPNVPALRQNRSRRLQRDALRGKLQAAMNDTSLHLISTLKPEIQQEAMYPYRALSPANREDILHYLLMASLKDLAFQILPDNLPTFARDPSKATIELRKNHVYIGTHYDEGDYHRFEFFGGGPLPASVLPPEKPSPEKPPVPAPTP